MRFAAAIRILFVLILALCFMNQHNSNMISSVFANQEMTGHPVSAGSFSSHAVPDVYHGDDIIAEMPFMDCPPELIRKVAVTFFVPAPVIANPSQCWQPPEFRS
ncbi:MAG: hypothetical protein D4R64_15885 [Porphyromonadaceae bacterium]|nr:MAG: hypothetical protein D4R64_15885 [Porphyromonadaceae bacterium]